MTPQNQAALACHYWALNFASLREAADRLATVAREPSLRRAALALGVPPTTFYHWYRNIVGPGAAAGRCMHAWRHREPPMSRADLTESDIRQWMFWLRRAAITPAAVTAVASQGAVS